MNWLQALRRTLSPAVFRNEAVRIAMQRIAHRWAPRDFTCHDTLPDNFSLYLTTHEPCWYVVIPPREEPGTPTLQSSHIMAIGRQTGQIHYDGSAGDEG